MFFLSLFFFFCLISWSKLSSEEIKKLLLPRAAEIPGHTENLIVKGGVAIGRERGLSCLNNHQAATSPEPRRNPPVCSAATWQRRGQPGLVHASGALAFLSVTLSPNQKLLSSHSSPPGLCGCSVFPSANSSHAQKESCFQHLGVL